MTAKVIKIDLNINYLNQNPKLFLVKFNLIQIINLKIIHHIYL